MHPSGSEIMQQQACQGGKGKVNISHHRQQNKCIQKDIPLKSEYSVRSTYVCPPKLRPENLNNSIDSNKPVEQFHMLEI
jgi:hypothetical protein